MSKKNRINDRAARAAAALEEQQRDERRRRTMMIGGVVAVILVIVAGGYFLSRALDTTTDVDAPAAGSEFGMTVGPADADHEVIVYEDFHCVHCADFEERTSDDLTQLAEEGVVRVEYRPVSFLSDYSARAANAFKVVLDESGADVGKTYHDLLFEAYDEASGSESGLDDDRLVELAVEAGAEEAAVRPGIEGMDQQEWADAAAQAAQDAGVQGTPTIVLDGEVFQDGTTTADIADNLLDQLQ
ncbi:MAG: thioredoxin domain-containing protein [Nocardioides sp.]